jgi:hypothetical protein
MPTHEEELFELLKVGATPLPETTTGDDEGKSTKGVTQIYEDPPGLETIPPDASQSFSPGIVEEKNKDRKGVLDNAFVGKANSDKSDQALISQNFARGKPGNFIAHSTQLKGEEIKKASHPHAESLSEAVRRLIGG